MTSNKLNSRRGRPPKNPGIDTRKALVRSGLEKLTEVGYIAAGIDQILRQVGVPKGSFYYYFDSKEAFGSAVMQAYHEYFAAKLDRHLLNIELLPLARLTAFVEDAKSGMAKFNYARGCLIGNLEQEVGLLPDSFREQLQGIYSIWQLKVCQCLEQAQALGQVAEQANCQQLAEIFWVSWEGAISRAKLVKSDAPINQFYQFFLQSLPSGLVD